MRQPRTPEEVITTTEHTQDPDVDLQEAATRNHAARRIIAGFTTALPTLAEIWQQLRGRARRHPRPGRRDHQVPRRTGRHPPGPGQPARRRPGRHHRPPRRRTRPPVLPAGRTSRSRPAPCRSGELPVTNPRQDAPPGPADTPRRHAAHDAHHRQRPAPRIRRGPGVPLGLAVPLRTRPALCGRRRPRRRVLAARRAPAMVGAGPGHRRRDGSGAGRVSVAGPGCPR